MTTTTIVLLVLAALFIAALLAVYALKIRPRLTADQIVAVRQAAALGFDVMESLAQLTPTSADEILLGLVRNALGLHPTDRLDELDGAQKRRGAIALARHFLGRHFHPEEQPIARAEFAARAAAGKASLSLAKRAHRPDFALPVAGPGSKQ